MSLRRVPISELLTALISRVSAQISPTKIYNHVPQGTPKPYVAIDGISAVAANLKDSGRQEVTVRFFVVSKDPSQAEMNSLVNGVLAACTRSFLTLTGDFVVEQVLQEGSIDVTKVSDGVEIYWTGSMRIEWTVRDLRDGG